MIGADSARELRALALDILRCEELEAVLDRKDSSCREVVSWQGLSRSTRWYVPEPWAGHLGSARILFVSSNPSAGDRKEPFDRGRHMSRRDSDEDLFAATDGAFDDPRFPGIAGGQFNRDRNGRRAGRAVSFWRWTMGIARELLSREPDPGADYALTEVVHCGSAGEAGVTAAMPMCVSRYLRRVLGASSAGVVVVVGARARRAFESELEAEFTGEVVRLPPSSWVWQQGELLGRTRYVVALPHPNARVDAHSLAGNLGPQLTAEIRAFLRAPAERSAATATERASLGSFLRTAPAASSHTRAPSLGCTSSTRSPAD
jgi:Uracil DNA glycosylase superfamily